MRMRNSYQVLIGKSEGKKPLGTLIFRWEDNIRMDLKATGCEGVHRIQLTQDTDQWRLLVNTVMNVRLPYNFLTS
jgi:hypothetical protein